MICFPAIALTFMDIIVFVRGLSRRSNLTRNRSPDQCRIADIPAKGLHEPWLLLMSWPDPLEVTRFAGPNDPDVPDAIIGV